MSRYIDILKRIAVAPLYAILLIAGWAVYLFSGRTPAFAYQSMIRLFCVTQGRSNDWLSSIIGIFKPPYSFPRSHSVLGAAAAPHIRAEAVSSLRRDGYYVFRQRLSDDVCDRLVRYATSAPSEMCPTDSQPNQKSSPGIYRRGAPQAIRYEFKPSDLLRNPDIQQLLADLSFAELAQDYLGSRPVVDVLSMWWVTAFSDRPDSRAAQYFHFDMDRPKWLKFFIYLTDVESKNGPHIFVRGSQRTGAIPYSILRKGYARLSDDEIRSAFGEDAITCFVAPRGTVIVEDTRGLHKGDHVSEGDRLMLQIQYSNSLFGATYPKNPFRGPLSEDLKSLTEAFPDIYSNYL
jgi:hypothetical protein